MCLIIFVLNLALKSLEFGIQVHPNSTNTSFILIKFFQVSLCSDLIYINVIGYSLHYYVQCTDQFKNDNLLATDVADSTQRNILFGDICHH